MDITEVGPARPSFRDRLRFIAKFGQQLFQFIAAAVHVADEVERAMLVPAVVPQWRPFDGNGLDFLGRLEHEDVPKALSLESLERTSQLRSLLTDDMSTEIAIRTLAISLLTHVLWQVEDDGNRQGVVLAGEATSGCRDSCCTFVASMTVSRPAASRFEAMKCRTSNASFVATWLFSSSLTRPRQ